MNIRKHQWFMDISKRAVVTTMKQREESVKSQQNRSKLATWDAENVPSGALNIPDIVRRAFIHRTAQLWSIWKIYLPEEMVSLEVPVIIGLIMRRDDAGSAHASCRWQN